MKRVLINIAATTTMILTGCAGGTNQSSATSHSVAGAQIALTAAEKAALTYASLPQCPKAPVCSDAATIAKLKAADNAAYAAVALARKSGAGADVATANAAIALLVSIVPAPAPAN